MVLVRYRISVWSCLCRISVYLSVWNSVYRWWIRTVDSSCGCTADCIPVYAVQAGTVAFVQAWDGHTLTNSQSWGNMILINHGATNGVTYTTRYAHLATVPPFSVGQALDKGTQLSTAGTTGNSTGIHLHLEVTANGTLVNPRNYVPI